MWSAPLLESKNYARLCPAQVRSWHPSLKPFESERFPRPAHFACKACIDKAAGVGAPRLCRNFRASPLATPERATSARLRSPRHRRSLDMTGGFHSLLRRPSYLAGLHSPRHRQSYWRAFIALVTTGNSRWRAFIALVTTGHLNSPFPFQELSRIYAHATRPHARIGPTRANRNRDASTFPAPTTLRAQGLYDKHLQDRGGIFAASETFNTPARLEL
jgi:hypothetical protein